MTNKTQYKSEALEAIHETINSLHQVGTVDKKTLRNFDIECLEIASEIESKNIRYD